MNSIIKTCEILCVGTELLLGDIVNTNAAYLSRQLAALGINVYRHTAVGDNPTRLSRALSSALEESDLVITVGGLGPTYDDLTKETVAASFGRPLFLHEHSLGRIREYFAKTGRVMTENNKKQAMMPEGATVFDNHFGTAPALALCDEEKNKTVIMLPGPPVELIPLFEEQIVPYLSARREGIIVTRNVYLFGIGESAMEEKIRDLLVNSKNPTVAPYCKEGEVRLRVAASAENADRANALCEEMIERLYASPIGEYIYGVDVDCLERALVERLTEKNLTLATAESCTGGLVAKRLTDISGASAVFAGGCVTYTNQMKELLLGVSQKTLERFGAVSEQTAYEMAEGVRKRLGTDVGISTTGLAGPGGGTAECPVGTIFIGVSTKDGTSVRALKLSGMRSREYLRTVAASHALDAVLKCPLLKK